MIRFTWPCSSSSSMKTIRSRSTAAGARRPCRRRRRARRAGSASHGSRGHLGEVRAQELQRVDADRESCGGSRRASAPSRSARGARRLGGRVERKRELASSPPSRARSASAGRGRAPRGARVAARPSRRRRPRRRAPRARRGRARPAARGRATSANGPPRSRSSTSASASVLADRARCSSNPIAHGAVLDRASSTALTFTCGGRTSTPRRCASRTRLAGG